MPKTSTNRQKTYKYGKCKTVSKCQEMRKTLKFENIEENGTCFGSVYGDFGLFADVLDDLGTVVAILATLLTFLKHLWTFWERLWTLREH